MSYPQLILKNQYGEESINAVIGGNITSDIPVASHTVMSNISGSSAVPIANTYSDLSAVLLPLMLLTGFSAGAGTVAGTDTVLQAIQKIAGNIQNKTVLANVLTGFSAGAGTVAGTDTVLQAIDKLAGNLQNKEVIANVLTGYTAGAGTVTAADTILQGLQKLDRKATHQADSVAADVPGLVADFNTLLGKLQTAGLMA